eukprot:g10230.t1
MNEYTTNTLQLEIDRLVGGDLDKASQRKLVERLDATPGGWKCCAMAFMEARSWNAAFDSLLVPGGDVLEQNAAPTAAADSPTPASIAVEASNSRMADAESGRRRGLLFAVTAAALAFVAGVGVTLAWKQVDGEHETRQLADKVREQPVTRVTHDPNSEEKPREIPVANDELVGFVSVSNNGVTESAFAVVGGEDFDGPPPQFAPPEFAFPDDQEMEMIRYKTVCGISLALVSANTALSLPAAVFANDAFVAADEKTRSKPAVAARSTDRATITAIYGAAPPPRRYLFVDTALAGSTTGSGNAIGIVVAPTDPVLRTQLGLKKGKYGMVVTRVIPGSPAAKAGVRQHDIVLSATGTGITAARDLDIVIQKTGRSKPLDIQLMRGGKTLTLQIQPAPVEKQPRWQNELIHLSYIMSSKYMIGVTTKSADAELIAQLVLPPATGRVITSVTAKSPAEAAGLQKHDVILKAGDKYIKSSDGLSKAIDKADGKAVSIEFIRAGRKQTCTIKPVKRSRDVRLIQPYNLHMLNLRTRPNNMIVGSQPQITWRIDKVRTVESQVESLSKQVGALQASLARLQKTLEALKDKKKKPAPKKK